jgi:hypothetical protein
MPFDYNHRLGNSFHYWCHQVFDRSLFIETCEFYNLYLQGNGQVESTKKVLGTLLTKLVSENIVSWDKRLSIVLFLYKIAYKVTIGYTPY